VKLLRSSRSSVFGAPGMGIQSPVRFNAPVLWASTEEMFTTRLVRS